MSNMTYILDWLSNLLEKNIENRNLTKYEEGADHGHSFLKTKIVILIKFENPIPLKGLSGEIEGR
jgi:hypothetical protein